MNLFPEILIIRVTENCNANCFMCDFSGINNGFNISMLQVTKIISAMEMLEHRYRLIRLTGGEPLLHPEICEIINRFKNNNYVVSLITNGSLLCNMSKSLIKSGIGQIIVSLDAGNAKQHNKFRKTDYLFERLIDGIKEIKLLSKDIVVRINTVVGTHNYLELLNIYDLLKKLDVDQWSIIPIKLKNNSWYKERQKLLPYYESFKIVVKRNVKPKLLGYSDVWAGRTINEINSFLTSGNSFTPRRKCYLVDKIRFISPQSELLFPCNCIPHRLDRSFLFSEKFDSDLSNKTLIQQRNWLRENGSRYCLGCEPVNAYIGEYPLKLKMDLFNY